MLLVLLVESHEPEDVDSAEEILCAGVSEDDSPCDQQCGNKGPEVH